MFDYVDFSVLRGKILTRIDVTRGYYKEDDNIVFTCSDGTQYRMFHSQCCCESVTIEDIVGDLEDLRMSPILIAEEVSDSNDTGSGSETWTFYKLSTNQASVTIRWYGSSNGYYSESVDFEQLPFTGETIVLSA